LVVSPALLGPPSCYGSNDGWAEVVAEGGTQPYVYQWDAAAGNQTTKRASNLAVGVYMFTVTDTNGCNITTDFVLVTQPAEIIITAPTSICVGSTATLTPSTGGTWVSSDPSKATITPAGIATGVAAGSVTFTFTDSSGCSVTSPVSIDPLPTTSNIYHN